MTDDHAPTPPKIIRYRFLARKKGEYQVVLRGKILGRYDTLRAAQKAYPDAEHDGS